VSEGRGPLTKFPPAAPPRRTLALCIEDAVSRCLNFPTPGMGTAPRYPRVADFLVGALSLSRLVDCWIGRVHDRAAKGYPLDADCFSRRQGGPSQIMASDARLNHCIMISIGDCPESGLSSSVHGRHQRW